MGEPIVAYVHKGCKTCARALAHLAERGASVQTVELFEAPLTREGLRQLFAKIGRSPADLLRLRDRRVRELDLRHTPRSEEELLALMVRHPGLIQRPILVRGERAVLGLRGDEIDAFLAEEA